MLRNISESCSDGLQGKQLELFFFTNLFASALLMTGLSSAASNYSVICLNISPEPAYCLISVNPRKIVRIASRGQAGTDPWDLQVPEPNAISTNKTGVFPR